MFEIEEEEMIVWCLAEGGVGLFTLEIYGLAVEVKSSMMRSEVFIHCGDERGGIHERKSGQVAAQHDSQSPQTVPQVSG